MAMKKTLLGLLLVISSLFVTAQVDTTKELPKMSARGYAVKHWQVDSSILFPLDTFRLKSTWRSIAFKNGASYYWDGSRWNALSSTSRFGKSTEDTAATANRQFNLGGYTFAIDSGKLLLHNKYTGNDSAFTIFRNSTPVFRVNSNDGYSYLTALKVENLQTEPGVTHLTTGLLKFDGNTQIQTYQQGLKITKSYPFFPDSTGLVLDNDTAGSIGKSVSDFYPFVIKKRDFSTNAASNIFKVRGDGRVTIADGTQASGRVLTSDANGNASWQVSGGGGGSSWALTDSIRGVIVQATPDDTGEDSTSFQNAVATGAKNIYVMPGTYILNATITLNKQNLIALGGGTVTLKTTRTTGSTSDGNTVFNVIWVKDSCVVDGINILGSGRDGSYTATYTIQNGIRISGNGNDIRNCKMHNLKGAGIYMFDEVFDAFYDNRITNITVDSSTVGYFNYYYGEYSIFSNSTIKDCRLGIIEYGNNNHIADVNVVWCTKAGIFNNGIGDDHGFISGCSFNHSGEIEFNSIDYGYNVSACQFYYTDIKCVNSDKVVIDGASFFNMAFNISGTSTVKTTSVSNSYIYNNVTTSVTGTGVLVKSAARGENTKDVSLEAIGALGSGKISVKSDTLEFYPPLGNVRIDSLASSNNAGDSMVVWNPATQMLGKRVISAGSSGWGLTGNSISGTDYLGSTNNHALRFYTNGVQRGYLDSATASLFLSGATVDARVKLVGQFGSTVDLNTGTGGVPSITMSSPAYIYAGGNNAIYLTNSITQFNNAGIGVDFKVSGSSSTTLIYGDATTNNNVGIGTATPAASALLQVSSTTKGFLPPVMTTSQRNAISSPATGLTIYCSDCTANDASTGVTQTYNGTTWKSYW